jgi:endonuclease/exonuclease/phosphatase (EEP) superfamily protein YafD
VKQESKQVDTGQSATRKTALWVRRATLFNGALLSVLWIIEFHIAERHWVSAVITYVPQHGVLLHGSALLALSLRHRQKRWAWANVILLVLAAHVFLGYQIPIQSTLARLQRRRATVSTAAMPLRVMSYNIMGGRRGMKALLQTIHAQKPDVLCLQEAEAWKSLDPMPQLQKALPGYHSVRSAEVATFSRYPIASRQVHPFPAWAQRDILETVLDVRGRRVRVLNVHLHTIDFTGGPLYHEQNFPTRVSNSMRNRGEQLAFLLAALDRPAQSTLSSAPSLVVGDFNTPPRGRVYAELAARFDDAWRQCGWGAGNTFRGDLPVVRIDYIWISRHFQPRRALVPGSQASDHRPLVVDLMLNQ